MRRPGANCLDNSLPRKQRKGQAGNANENCAGHSPIEGEQVEPRADCRLGCRYPFKQMTTRGQNRTRVRPIASPISHA